MIVDDRTEVERKRDALAAQLKRLEWMLWGGAREITKLTASPQTAPAELVQALSVAHSVAQEYQTARKELTELDPW